MTDRLTDRSLQTRVLTAIRRAATERGYDTVETWHASNVGVLRFMPPGTFDATASLRVNFQDTDATLDLKPGFVNKWSFTGGTRLPYNGAFAQGLTAVLLKISELPRIQGPLTGTV